MKKITTGIIAISFCVLVNVGADAQTWRSFTTADGLADNSVNCMLEDKNGDLWFGTDKGLSQFNGLFTTHLSGRSISPLFASSDGKIWAGTWDGLHSYDGTMWQEHLSGRNISSLLESFDGKIWVGTWDESLYSYDGAMWQEHLSGMRISSLFASSDGKVWAGTWDESLYSYDGTTWQEHLSGMRISSLFASSDGKIWAGTWDGLHSYDGAMWQEHLSGMDIRSLLESSDGKIWAGTWDGLYSYDGTTWQEHLSGMDIRSLLESSDGKIWAGTWDGLHSYDGSTWQEHLSGMRIKSLLASSDGKIWAGTWGLYSYDWTTWQEHLSIHSLLESSDGMIWALKSGDGLYSYDGSTWREHLSGGIDSLLASSDGMIWARGIGDGLYSYDGSTWQEHLSGRSITYPLESSDGTIWVRGTWDGLYSYDGATWQEHLSGMRIHSLLTSSDGTIWAGTQGDGLYSYDGTTWQGHLSGIDIDSLIESSGGTIWAGNGGLYSYDGTTWQEHLSGIDIDSLIESSGGTIWARGTRDDGSYLYSYDGTTWQEHSSGINIYSFTASSDGTIWVCMWDGGLYSYDGTTWQEHSIGIDIIYYFIESSDGTIWAGTWDESLYSYDGTTWQEHLSGMRISSLLTSSDGKIWVGTQGNGLHSYDGTTWQAFTISDGLPGNHIDEIFFEDTNGNLWFWTINGIGMYKPNYNPPMIEITNPKEKVVKTGAASIFIEWRAGDIETETSRLTYQYKIDEDGWSKPTPANFMTTPPVSDGEHIFYVRAIDRDFNYSEAATLTIIVDTIRPNILISSPTQGAIVGGTVKIMGGITDTDLDKFQVEYAEGEEPSDAAYTTIGESENELKFGQLAELDTTSLKEGKYTIRVRAIDKLNHTRDDTVTFTVDNTKPVVKINTPTQNQKFVDKTTVTGKIDDPHIANYTLQIIQGSNVKWSETAELSTSQSIERKDIDTSAIYGDAIVRLTAIDLAGNQSVPTDVNVFFDNEGARPTARLDVPKENDVIAGIFEIKGEAKSVGTFKSYVVEYAKGQNPSEDDWIEISLLHSSQLLATEGANPSEEKLATWDTTKLPDGKYSIQLTVIDEYDYVSEHIVHIVIDNMKPKIELTSPEEDSIEADDVSIKGTVTDDNFNNYKFEFAPGVNPSTGWKQWGEITTNETIEISWPTVGLDGLYSIRITATDKAIPYPNQAILVWMITLDNTVAEAKITYPESGKVYKEIIEIKGIANDDNFSDYQLFWGKGEKPSGWNPITGLMNKPITDGVLGSWDTTRLDGVYTIKLVAHDKSGHETSPETLPEKNPPVTIIVDNTKPKAEITSPRKNEQAGAPVKLIGTAIDDWSFKEYIIHYGEGTYPKVWIEADEDALRTKSVTKSKLFDWNPKIDWKPEEKSRKFTLRLTVTDEVDHQSQDSVTVEVLPPIKSQEAGKRTSSDGLAMLYLPPRALPKDTVITINRVPESEILPPPDNVQSLNLAYDIGPADLKLNSIKPATLQIKLEGIPTQNHKRIAVFRWDEKWIFLGGTVREDKVIIGITTLGRYALMAVETTPPVPPDFLFTCQPRVFSPEQGATTISFSLQKEASVTLKIYNIDGRLQRTLVSEETMYAGRNAVLWDGKDSNDRIVPSSLYIIALKIGDEKVNTKTVVVQNR